MLQLDYKVVLNAFADAMIVAAPDGRIIYANPAVEKVLGWEPSEIIGQPLTIIVPGPDRRNFVHEATATSSAIVGRAVRRALLHRDGSEIEVELSLSTVFVGSRPVWIAGVRDLRDRLELEANAQLYREAQEAVRARDEFLSVASHELKTPLCALALSLQTLVMRANSAPSEAPSLQERSRPTRWCNGFCA